MARRTQTQALVTRQRILDAALQVFAERGFEHSAMQDVAQRAGVTRGAVYWHFRDQMDLLEALLDETQLPWQALQPLRPSLHPPLQGGTAAQQRPTQPRMPERMPERQMLERLGTEPLAWLQASVPAQQLLRILGHGAGPQGSQRLTQSLEADRKAALACFDAALTQAGARGALRPGTEPAVAALGLFALVEGLMHQWLRQSQGFALLAVGSHAVRSHLAGVFVG
jgi:AcrR family transcriptional regulator